jgi:glycosyltransferase involved in cell wall biosynthesis
VKLLLLTPMPPDATAPGAIPVLLQAQLEGLAERHAVTLVTVAGPDAAEIAAVRRLAAVGVDIHAVERRPLHGRSRWARRARLADAWLAGRWPWRTIWFWQPRVQAVIDRLAARTSFDVIIAEDNAMGIYGLPAGPLRVLTEHEVRRERSVGRPPVAPRRWLRWSLAEADWRRWPEYQRSVWRSFDAVQVFTARDAGSLAAIAPELAERVDVNPFAVAMPDLERVPVQPGTVVFLGNYTHPPNVDAALWLAKEIMPRLRTLHPGARLALAGIHAPREIRSLAAPDIAILGAVPDAEALMRRSAVVLAPVRIGGGMRMKVLHAMALARPVVTTTRGTEGLDTDGRPPPLAVADDADGIASATAEFLSDPAAGERLGAAARDYVSQHHTPSAYAERLDAVVDRALARRSHAAAEGP